MSSARGDEHHNPTVMTSVLSGNPAYQRVLDAFYELFGTQDIAFSRGRYLYDHNALDYAEDVHGNFIGLPELIPFLVDKTGLPYEEVGSGYRWLLNIGIIEECGVDSPGGGSKGEQVRLNPFDVRYVSQNIRGKQPQMTKREQLVFRY